MAPIYSKHHVPISLVVGPFWAILTAIVLYAHLLADLVWDVRRGMDPA